MDPKSQGFPTHCTSRSIPVNVGGSSAPSAADDVTLGAATEVMCLPYIELLRELWLPGGLMWRQYAPCYRR